MELLGVLTFAAVIYICSSQQVVFEDQFDGPIIDKSKWKFEKTLSGGHDWQFQWFVNDPENAFIKEGVLHIKPTLTADKFGEEELYRKKVEIDSKTCTSSHNYGCSRTGSRVHILNPIRSASIQTKKAFKYGNIEIKAKLPAGDWLRPSIKLVPKDNFYGEWPKSGEIDLVEARGNRLLYTEDEESVGIDKVSTTLHFGPQWNLNGWEKAHFIHDSDEENFHLFKLDWSEKGMKFSVDGKEIGNFSVSNGSFWDQGHFEGNDKDLENPWIQGTPMAPFDKEFYIVISLAVGGVSDYFSDNFENRPYPKPWPNSSQKAPLLFWRAKNKWFKTWTLSHDSADFQIDYVKILSQ